MKLLYLRDGKNEEREEPKILRRQTNACDKCFLLYNCPTGLTVHSQPYYICQTTNTAAGNSAQDSESLVPSISLWKEGTRRLNLYLCLLLSWALSDFWSRHRHEFSSISVCLIFSHMEAIIELRQKLGAISDCVILTFCIFRVLLLYLLYFSKYRVRQKNLTIFKLQ